MCVRTKIPDPCVCYALPLGGAAGSWICQWPSRLCVRFTNGPAVCLHPTQWQLGASNYCCSLTCHWAGDEGRPPSRPFLLYPKLGQSIHAFIRLEDGAKYVTHSVHKFTDVLFVWCHIVLVVLWSWGDKSDDVLNVTCKIICIYVRLYFFYQVPFFIHTPMKS